MAAPAQVTSVEAIDAFRPIAAAPLDMDPRRQGRDVIQPDQRDALLADPALAAYAAELAALGVGVDESLLGAYNRFSRDDAVEVVRFRPPRVESDDDRRLSALMNDPARAEARARLLAFVRAQVLWNRYKMDPQWMLQMMERYGPIDWRLVWPHGLYWAGYGMHVVFGAKMDDIDTLNTGRIVMGCLKDLTWQGRLTMQENPRDPEWPEINLSADWRFIEYTQREYERLIARLIAERTEPFENNMLRDGHVNYLVAAIEMLYAMGRHDEAQHWFDWIKEKYKKTGGEWDLDDLEEFVYLRITKDGSPIAELALNQMTAALQTSYLLALRGDRRRSDQMRAYAARVYLAYQKDAPERIRFPSFAVFERNMLRVLLLWPRSTGVYLSLDARSRLYRDLLPNAMQLMLYDAIAQPLRALCERGEVDFDAAFPAPEGLEEYRRRELQRLEQPDAAP